MVVRILCCQVHRGEIYVPAHCPAHCPIARPVPAKDYCSASMIAPNLVITAAHCVSNFGSSCYPSGTFTASEYSGAHLESQASTFSFLAGFAVPSLTLSHTRS